MTNQQISNQIRYIINLDKNPLLKDTAIAHLKALLSCIENDELEQAKRELNIPVPGKSKSTNYDKEQHNIDADIILEHIDDVLVRELDSLQEENPFNMASTKIDFEAMRKRIFKKIKDKITGRTTLTVPVIQCHAVINFWLACINMDKRKLIENAFEGTENEVHISHYKEMLFEMEYNMNEFFVILSEDQRCLIIQYIMKNYSGITVNQIEKYVQ